MHPSPNTALPTLSSTFPLAHPDPPLADQYTQPRRRSRLLHHHRQSASEAEIALQKERENAVRSARREIRSRIREDWEWPAPFREKAERDDNLEGEGNGDAAGEERQQHQQHQQPPPPPPPPDSVVSNRVQPDTCWREREIDSSVPPSPSQEENSPTSAYAFEGPDSVGDVLMEREVKRRKRMVAEMSFNAGLRAYVARRDAWTGGLTARRREGFPPSLAKSTTMSSAMSSEKGAGAGHAHMGFRLDGAQVPPPASILVTSTAQDLGLGGEEEDLAELVPLPPPLLPPANLVRASITPAVYPAIYSKVAIQGVAPTVPINLLHMTRALVEGWKADGEWPPKSSVPGEGGGGHLGGAGGGGGGGGRRESMFRNARVHSVGGIQGVVGGGRNAAQGRNSIGGGGGGGTGGKAEGWKEFGWGMKGGEEGKAILGLGGKGEDVEGEGLGRERGMGVEKVKKGVRRVLGMDVNGRGGGGGEVDEEEQGILEGGS